jgi:3-oxoacyl-[acyl-carrier protein] reductase
MEIDLSGRSAIVCGSTQGIGLETARQLASSGCKILLIARNFEKLAQVKESLPNQNLDHSFVAVDFSEPKNLQEKLSRMKETGRWAHILVNNTGGPKGGAASEANVEEYRIAFNAHLICNQILLHQVLPLMKKTGFGRIINIISTSVKQPIPGLGVSNTIRAAVANWAKTLSEELGSFGITVNNVLPGATQTQRLESLIQSKSKAESETYENIAEKLKGKIPAGRFGTPEEIANAIRFLASEEAGYINGINLPVDGGRTGNL